MLSDVAYGGDSRQILLYIISNKHRAIVGSTDKALPFGDSVSVHNLHEFIGLVEIKDADVPHRRRKHNVWRRNGDVSLLSDLYDTVERLGDDGKHVQRTMGLNWLVQTHAIGVNGNYLVRAKL